MKTRKNIVAPYVLAMLALMGCASSCNENLEVVATTSAEAEMQALSQRYKEDFEQTFGQIDPHHTWGFGGIPAAGSMAQTRAASLPAGEQRRVMCEDLASFDHDFNDVVFDVSFVNVTSEGMATARITLQAAGGTLPVYIGSEKQDEAYEVHHLFGVSSVTPVNVQGAGVSCEPITFTYPEQIQGVSQDETWLFNPNSIEIYVGNTTGQVTVLQTTVGGAPQKFACATTVAWSKELQNINLGYKLFGQWAQNDSGWQDSWTQREVNSSFLNAANSQAPLLSVLPIAKGINADDSTK